jgi:hypothetical protein
MTLPLHWGGLYPDSPMTKALFGLMESGGMERNGVIWNEISLCGFVKYEWNGVVCDGKVARSIAPVVWRVARTRVGCLWPLGCSPVGG